MLPPSCRYLMSPLILCYIGRDIIRKNSILVEPFPVTYFTICCTLLFIHFSFIYFKSGVLSLPWRPVVRIVRICRHTNKPCLWIQLMRVTEFRLACRRSMSWSLCDQIRQDKTELTFGNPKVINVSAGTSFSIPLLWGILPTHIHSSC